MLDSRMECLIDMIYNPVKELGIDVLGQCITHLIRGLQLGDGLDMRLCGSGQLPMAEPVTHLLKGHTHEVTEDAEGVHAWADKENGLFPGTRSIK